MDELEKKQQYLRTEIIDKGYDGEEFQKYIMDQNQGEEVDLERFSFGELQFIVTNFQHTHKFDENNIPKEEEEDTNEQPQNFYSEQQDLNFEENQHQNNPTEMPETTDKEPQAPQKKKVAFFSNEDAPTTKTEENPPVSDVVGASGAGAVAGLASTIGGNDDTYINKNTPFAPYQLQIPCIKQEENEFTSMEKINIIVKDPQMMKKGFFAKSYFLYTIEVEETSYKAQRRLSDFEWLRATIINLNPGILISPLPPDHMNLKDNSPKKVSYLNRFINALAQNKFVRSLEIFKDFLTLPEEEFNTKKKNVYGKLERPRSLGKFKRLDGVIFLNITPGNVDKAKGISTDCETKTTLYTKLNKSLDSLLEQQEEMNKRYKDLSNCFYELKKAYTSDKVMENGFAKLGELMGKWSAEYIEQKGFFLEEMKYYFKYMKRELENVHTVYKSYNQSKDAYLSQLNRTAKMNVDRERKNLQDVKRYFGFYLMSLLEDYEELGNQHRERFLKHFEEINMRASTMFQDYKNFIGLINFSV